MSTTHFKKVRKHLSDNCPVMKRIITRVGPCTLKPKSLDPFTLLVRCVISQQISTKAAESIAEKLVALVGDPESGTIPLAKLAKLSEEKYKSCGISGPKQIALGALVAHIKANPKLLPGIPELSDDAIREHLTCIKGIGPWTADMFLIFAIMREDVWPTGDYGLKVAVKNQFNLRKLPNPERMERIAQPWKPYRSIAGWYLWRTLEKGYQESEK